MASGHELATGLRGFDRLASSLDRVTAFASALGTGLILAIMLLIVADVVGRFLFGRPIAGVPELVAMSILAIVFLQIADTLARGKLTRAEVLLAFLERRAPRAAEALNAVLHAVGALLAGVLVSAFYPLFLRSWGRDEMVGTVGQFLAPIWPVHLVVLIGAALLFAVFAMRAAAHAIRAWRGPPDAAR